MKKTSLFYTSRFLFQRRGPEGPSEPVRGRRTMPEAERQRTAAEIRESQSKTVREIYATQRERVRALHGKKKLQGETYPREEVRVVQSRRVIKTDGMPDHVDPNDKIKVLDKGQIYEIGGAKYVRVEVSGNRGPRGAARRFAAYIIVEPSVDDKGQKWDPLSGDPVNTPAVLRDMREKEGLDVTRAYVDEVQKYLDSVAAKRFYLDVNGVSSDETVVTVRDAEQGNRVVSWALVDMGKDAAGNYFDVDSAGNPTVLFGERERQYGRESSATVAMGSSGTNPDATYAQDPEVRAGKVPEPDKRVRLAGPDTVHYSLNDAIARAKREIDYYLKNNPSSGFPGLLPGDDGFRG